jgi:hypothetical protein
VEGEGLTEPPDDDPDLMDWLVHASIDMAQFQVTRLLRWKEAGIAQ